MSGRCVYFSVTAVWCSEDEEKHRLPRSTVKKKKKRALMDCQHSYLKFKSDHTPTHTHRLWVYAPLRCCRRPPHPPLSPSLRCLFLVPHYGAELPQANQQAASPSCHHPVLEKRIGLCGLSWGRQMKRQVRSASGGRPGTFIMGTSARSALGQ